jgi:YMGG-like Gly-zipper
MVKHGKSLFVFVVFLALAGCATIPTGPSVMVLPPAGKSFEKFQAEDAICRQWARQQIGLSPQETVNQNTANSAVIGTVIGAGVGAAIGSASGNMGSGAAIGAGSGLLLGAASGAGAGRVYGWEAQRRYDNTYMQCMYAKGNLIPGVTRSTRRVQRIPPPPPGFPPPDSDSVPPDYSPPTYPEP